MAAKPSLVLSHWYHLFDSFQESPKGFYQCLEERLKARTIPDLTICRVDYHEGGAFSARREYFRVMRLGYVFDVCAAPFGDGFFVSWWLAKPLPAWGYLAILGTLLGALFMLPVWMYVLGILQGITLVAVVLTIVLLIIADQLRSNGYALGDLIVSIPVLGAIARLFFVRDTYFKTDTALMFQESVRRAVLEVVDQITETKGLRGLSESDRKPILNSLFQR